MSENVEIEFKNLITENEFKHLIKKFNLDNEAFWSQTNYYFDTLDFLLKQNGYALRIREKLGKFEFTLKQPTDDGIGLLETNQYLDKEIAESLIRNGKIPVGPIANKLSLILNENQEITCFGKMKTERTEIKYEDGLLVFDKSFYFDVIDYEIEYEVQHYNSGQKSFQHLLESENIPIRKTPNKIRRFYDVMKQQNY
ncbi:MAG: hypothetical protein K0R71_904 [Bacillales bacterium]|jgi:uncharacterized protein YjbK|nr:hypothetical protein [Bacillales bacterium]